MARQPRFILPGHPLHIIQRGNNRLPTFFADDDYRCYLDYLSEAAGRYGCEIHAYVLMTNHVHLLLTPLAEGSVSSTLQHVGRRYVRYINYTYRRTGTLWEGRYKSSLIDSGRYLLTCYRYIELNPVRAGMVKNPARYPWSSYSAHAFGQADSLIRDHALYIGLGSSAQERQLAYRALFKGHLDDKTLSAIRETANKGWVLGDGRFKEEVEGVLGRRVTPLPKGGDRRSKEYIASKQ